MVDESDNKPERRSSGQKPPEQLPKPPEAKASEEQRMSPREHALATGNGPKPGQSEWTGPGFSRVMGSVQHETAKILHGWDDHEHETGTPMQLTRGEYLAALKATHPEDEYELDEKGTPKTDRFGNPIIKTYGGNAQPHKPALSEFKGKRGTLKLGEAPQPVKA
jgi:hypothetical protein